MPSYDIKCTKCEHVENWLVYPSQYTKDIVEKKCPKCGSDLQQDFSTINPLICNGVEGYSKINPAILREESKVLRENDQLQKMAKTDKRFLRKEDEVKRFEDKMGSAAR